MSCDCFQCTSNYLWQHLVKVPLQCDTSLIGVFFFFKSNLESATINPLALVIRAVRFRSEPEKAPLSHSVNHLRKVCVMRRRWQINKQTMFK